MIVQDTEPKTASRIETALFGATATMVLAAIVFPRSAAAMFAIPVLATFALLAFDQTYTGLRFQYSPVAAWLLALAGWSMLTAIWSPAPGGSLSKPLFLIGAVLGVALLSLMAQRSKFSLGRAATNGIVLAVLIGGVLIAIESLTQQGISRFLMTQFPALRQGLEKHVLVTGDVVMAMSDANLKRRCTVFTLLIVPVGLILSQLDDRKRRIAGLAILAALTSVVFLFSGHQSSKAAIAAAAVVFLLARVSRIWALRAVGAGWIFAVLLAIPLVMAAHSAGLHTSVKVPTSAQQRVVIWNTTAREILKSPMFCIGADATATVTLQKESSTEVKVRDGDYEASTARHAHNAYLQVWYELGLAGVIIFLGSGLAALMAIGRLPAAVQPYFLAQFAAFAALIAFSFSIWQLWFQAAIGLGAATLIVAGALRRQASQTR